MPPLASIPHQIARRFGPARRLVVLCGRRPRRRPPPRPSGVARGRRCSQGAALLLAWLAACSEDPARPTAGSSSPAGGTAASALLVTLDTTRLNTLGLYGCPADSTPALDRLAQESLVYDRCRTTAPITLPAHASMLTGLYPPRHGLRDNGLAPLPEAAVTLAERAREAGLATGAFVAALVLDRQYRLSQGFDVYDQPERPEQQDSSRYAERPAEEVLSAALAWLDGLPADRRFLLWVHLFDPHAPYDAPPEFLEQVAPARPPSNAVMAQVWAYTAEIARTDDALGGFLEELRARGRLEDTAVVVVADHGEGLWDHEEPNHAPYVYDTTMRVPFLVRYPDGHRAGERSDEITSVVDVAPTLCSALGLAPLEDVDGVDLWRARAPDGRGVYFESYHGYLTYGWAQLAGWADADGKYIHGHAPELYLVSEDRRETRNLLAAPASGPAAPHSAVGHAEGYRRAIAEVAARPALAPEDFEDPSAERLEAIAALGYATAAPRALELPGPLELGERPAPATRREELVRFLQAQQLLDTRRPDQAAPILRQILADNPGHLAALEKLGLACLMQGDWPGAIEAFERRLALADGVTATFVNLAFACEQVGRLEEARAHLERALELDPEEPTARANLERVRARLAAE